MAKISFTIGAILSAKNIFLKNPNAIIVAPICKFDFVKMIKRNFEVFSFSVFSLNCGRNSLALSMGPATICGKNATKIANSRIDLLGSSCPR
jgi:hypothetical protein